MKGLLEKCTYYFDTRLMRSMITDVIRHHKIVVILLSILTALALTKVYLVAKNREIYYHIDRMVRDNHTMESKNEFLQLIITQKLATDVIEQEAEALGLKNSSTIDNFVEY